MSYQLTSDSNTHEKELMLLGDETSEDDLSYNPST